MYNKFYLSFILNYVYIYTCLLCFSKALRFERGNENILLLMKKNLKNVILEYYFKIKYFWHLFRAASNNIAYSKHNIHLKTYSVY